MADEKERYTDEDFAIFRRLEHHKHKSDYKVEWVFPNFGELVLTFDRVTFYNGYRDRDLLTEEQIKILRKEGSKGCVGF